MKTINVSLITGILALIVFIGFMGETDAKPLFGFSVNIWVYRLAWLFIAITFLTKYFRMKQSEKEST